MQSVSGAFVKATWGGNGYLGHASKSGSVDYINFSATKSNIVYGNSDTITPKSCSVKYFIKF